MTDFPRPDIVSVVACGPSALACGAASAPGFVIAVNGAADHVNYTAALTMDGRFSRNRWQDFKGRNWFCRDSAWAHAMAKGAARWPGLNVFVCDRKSTTFGAAPKPGEAWRLNGGHSGYCALNLAYALRPRLVYLYGFDMDAPTHFFGDYPWKDEAATNSAAKFIAWSREMPRAAEQFKAAGIGVINTNPRSRITAFKFGRP